MADCRELEPTLTAYVDGECDAGDRGRIEEHLLGCPRCRSVVQKERAAHELLRARCGELRGSAPEGLRRRCAAHRAPVHPPRAARPARPWVTWSVAATFTLATAVFVLFGWGGAVETYAAQLAADHLKCFHLSPEPVQTDAVLLGRQLQTANGWPLKVAPPSSDHRLELLTVRSCSSTRGRVIHALYRWRGQPLSMFVLNSRIEDVADATHSPEAHDAVRKFGEQEILWSQKGRTYAVVAKASLGDLKPVATYLRRRTE